MAKTAISLAFLAPMALKAQAPAPNADIVRTIYLKNVAQQNDANEVMVALRNMLEPRDKVYLVASQNAVVVEAPPEQIELAQRLVSDLDRPRKLYRLTYTLTEVDGGKRLSERHVAMVVGAGQRTMLKQGTKVPVATGSFDTGSSKAETQFTYLDIGLNFDASIDGFVDGLRLRSKVERSSLAEGKSDIGAQDPVVQQTVLEGTSTLIPGKPLVLGSLDIPDSTRHLEIEVVAEPVS